MGRKGDSDSHSVLLNYLALRAGNLSKVRAIEEFWEGQESQVNNVHLSHSAAGVREHWDLIYTGKNNKETEQSELKDTFGHPNDKTDNTWQEWIHF